MNRQKTQRQTGKRFLAVTLLVAMTIGMLGTVASANENSEEKVHDYLDWVTFDQEILGVEWAAYQAWPSDAISTSMRTYYRPVVYVPLGTTVAVKPERISNKFRITDACNVALTDETIPDFVMQKSFDQVQIWSTERVKYGIYDYQERWGGIYTYVHGGSRTISLDYSLYIVGVDMNALAASGKQFADVSDSDYYAVPVAWAVERGITTGTSTYMFSADEKCTVGQILFPNLIFGNNIFDLSHFARRQRRQPQNTAILLPTFPFGSNILFPNLKFGNNII